MAKTKTPVRMPVATGFYKDIILKNILPSMRSFATEQGVAIEHVAGGIEHWIRLEYSTLDRLSAHKFRAETLLACECIRNAMKSDRQTLSQHLAQCF